MNEMTVSSSRPKRILGMTVAQLVILGCLSLMALGMVCGGFFFVSGSMGGGLTFVASPAPTSTSQPTLTPYLTPTSTATATLVPYEDLIPAGWVQYTTDTIELWVPPQFEQTDLDEAHLNNIKVYKDLGYADYAEDLENNPPVYIFWFDHSDPGTNMIVPNIVVERTLMSADNLDAYIDQEYAGSEQNYNIVNRQEFRVGNYEARRILLETKLSNIYLGAAQYVIYDGTNVWFIICNSHINDLYTLLPDFDRVARTFRLIGEQGGQ